MTATVIDTPERYCDGAVDLRLGKWQDVLADVAECDAVITDPPYSEKTHSGNADMAERFGGAPRRSLDEYESMGAAGMLSLIAAWSSVCGGWVCVMTDDQLILETKLAAEGRGRYAFAAVPIISPRVRLTGDGPASCAVYLMVSRPRSRSFLSWGALRGWYYARVEKGIAIGSKPLALMRAIVSDYSRPGDLIVDPCAGGATTLLAAKMEGRRAIGAEMDPITFTKAADRLRGLGPMQDETQPNLFEGITKKR